MTQIGDPTHTINTFIYELMEGLVVQVFLDGKIVHQCAYQDALLAETPVGKAMTDAFWNALFDKE